MRWIAASGRGAPVMGSVDVIVVGVDLCLTRKDVSEWAAAS